MTDLSLDDAPGATLFENPEWRVLADGIEHRRTGYAIARESIAMRREGGLWAWPLQLGEKSWCAPRAFREAFLAALDLFDIPRDGLLTRSFAAGLGGGAVSRQAASRQALPRDGLPRDGFVALGDLVRPRPAPRRRPAAGKAPAFQRGAASWASAQAQAQA